MTRAGDKASQGSPTARTRAVIVFAASILVTAGSASAEVLPRPRAERVLRLPRVEAAPQKTPRVILGRTNVITGRRSAMVDVRIPRKAQANVRLDVGKRTGPNHWIDIEGAGRAAGFALMPDPPSDDLSSRFLMATRLSKCAVRGCSSRHDPIIFMRPFTFGDGPQLIDLPRGRYRLYLIADGTRVKITLRLKGLSGTRRIQPRKAAPVDVQAPRTRVFTQGSKRSIYSAGSTYKSGSRGFFVSAIYVLGRRFEGAAWGMCAYNAPPPPEQTAYGPHCSALTYGAGLGAGSFGFFSGGPNARGFWVVIMSSYGPGGIPPNLDGRRGLGAWYASPGPLDEFGSQAFYLSYD